MRVRPRTPAFRSLVLSFPAAFPLGLPPPARRHPAAPLASKDRSPSPDGASTIASPASASVAVVVPTREANAVKESPHFSNVSLSPSLRGNKMKATRAHYDYLCRDGGVFAGHKTPHKLVRNADVISSFSFTASPLLDTLRSRHLSIFPGRRGSLASVRRARFRTLKGAKRGLGERAASTALATPSLLTLSCRPTTHRPTATARPSAVRGVRARPPRGLPARPPPAPAFASSPPRGAHTPTFLSPRYTRPLRWASRRQRRGL